MRLGGFKTHAVRMGNTLLVGTHGACVRRHQNFKWYSKISHAKYPSGVSTQTAVRVSLSLDSNN